MNAIVAVDQNWAIGKEGDQLCYLSADLKRFKELTLGHPVILGRKTLATFPGGRPLKGRRNLVLSRDRELHIGGAEVYHDLESLLSQAPEDSFVIGGESVYRSLLDRCDTVYVTKIAHSFPADTWFPDLDEDPAWQVTGEEDPLEEKGLTFRYVTYERVK
ncbi:MAG: dihydrofolate reductase [Oscillospiraceae bacterium]|jgi:dihydrofolate reductase|nr:dihydrofolate reductase [Oscillospiraceae bacterium]